MKDTDNLQKRLASLAMPPLAARKFLNIGCGNGYFCGYAFFDAASAVLGIDTDALCIKGARAAFPQCSFIQADNEDILKSLPENGNYDVILSTLPPVHSWCLINQLQLVMSRLSRAGMMALEILAADGNAGLPEVKNMPGWHMPEAHAGCQPPSLQTVEMALSGYAYKYMGESQASGAGSLRRHIYHVRNPLPFAVLLIGSPGSGKSTIARKVLGHMRLIRGDALLMKVVGRPEICPRIAMLSAEGISCSRIDIFVRRIFETDAWKAYVELIAAEAGGQDFAFDGYIPKDRHEVFAEALAGKGYQVALMSGQNPAFSPNDLSRRGKIEARKYQCFFSAYMRGQEKRIF